MRVTEPVMKSCSFTLNITPQTAPEFIDITSRVQEHVEKSGIKNGILTVFSRHTTAAIIIQENDKNLVFKLKDKRNIDNKLINSLNLREKVVIE